MSAGKVMKDNGVKIMLDKERTFRFDLNALCIIEEKYDNITEAFDGIGERNFKKIRSMVHAVIAHEEDETFTEVDAGRLVNMQNLNEVADALTEAIRQAKPEALEQNQEVESVDEGK